MTLQERIFGSALGKNRPLLSVGDGLVLLCISVLLYLGVRLALNATPISREALHINLQDPAALPYYAMLSMGRMLASYTISLIIALFYGAAAARGRTAEGFLLPILDILQAMPLLTFLPVVLLSLIAILPDGFAIELSSIILLVTCQAWNLVYSYYQSLTTLPRPLKETAAVYRFSPWLRFKVVELPSAAVGLIWNSVISWANGWFFLMAAEIFTLGNRDFRLLGLGAYLQTAASEGNTQALWMGIGILVLIIILLDQLVWRPLLAWAERFKFSQVEDDNATTSWFLNTFRGSWASDVLSAPFKVLVGGLDALLNRPPKQVPPLDAEPNRKTPLWHYVLFGLVLIGLAYGAFEAGKLLITIPLETWGQIALGAGATLLRILASVTFALLWTIPVGVWIGTNPDAARIMQPIVQVIASVPATALFPVLLLGLLNLPMGGDIAAVLLMMLGTQWYILFNVIAGASAIPQDLKYSSDLLQVRGWRRWRTLILPAVFPYILTGVITASGGAWNASIVAEYANLGERTSQVFGLGSLIAAATVNGDYALMLAAALTMIVLVVLFNRFIWMRLLRVAENRFRID